MKVSKLVKQLLKQPQDNEVYFTLALPCDEGEVGSEHVGEIEFKAIEAEMDDDPCEYDDNPGYVDIVSTSRNKKKTTIYVDSEAALREVIRLSNQMLKDKLLECFEE